MELNENIHEHPSEDHLKILKDRFKLDNFKEDQWKAISQIMYQKKDVFICANSGYGKSLIYQFCPVFLNKKSIIISPLISLMETQVQKLQDLGISACFTSGQQKNVVLNIKDYSVIYTTPENFPNIRGHIKWAVDNDEICLIAIDEVHCISRLSADHRPAYSLIKSVKESFPSVPIVALTSTASKDTVSNICTLLSLKNPLMIKLPLDRPNIEYICKTQTHCFITDVRNYLQDLPTGSGVIIYCFKKRDTENYAEILTREGFAAKPYNSGLIEEIRRETLRDFMSGRLNIIVTTNAFGMGVDRSDVRVVINYGLPKSPEVYYMESGRAGRDELPAKSIIFWSDKDIKFHNYCMKENSKSKFNSNFKNFQILLNKMQEFSYTPRCRRAELLKYLEEIIPPVHSESCCDNCLKIIQKKVGLCKMYKEINDNGKLDITDDVRMILNLINSYQGKCRYESIVDFITGTMPSEFDTKHPVQYFARGINKPKNWWSTILKVTKSKNFLDKYTVVRSTENLVELWGGITRHDYVRVTNDGIKFMRYKSKKLVSEPWSDFLPSLTKTDTEYYIIDDVVHEKPRVHVDDIKAFDLSALSSTLNKSSPRKRMASESDASDVSLAELMKSPLKDAIVVERCPKLQKISESNDNQPSCSYWGKDYDKEVMQIYGDKEQKYEESNNVDNNNLKLKECKCSQIRMQEGYELASSSSENFRAKSV